MLTKIYLIRHGVTAWNRQKKYCGCRDVPLSPEGRKQARMLGLRLKALSFDVIYSSDRKRALATAAIVFGRVKITRDKGLREINFGVFEGLSHKQILQRYPQVYSGWLKDPFSHDIPRGERLIDFGSRVRKALRGIVKKNKGKCIAVVCHGGAISMVVSGLLKKKNFWKYVPDSTSVTILQYSGNKASLELFNCTRHLKLSP